MARVEKIATLYAAALIELAREGKFLEEMETELKQSVDIFIKEETVWKFFISPIIRADVKLKIISTVFKKEMRDVVYNFLGVLAARGRMKELPDIVKAYSELLDEELGRMHVSVESASPISEEQARELREVLTKYFKVDTILDIKENPELLGGLIIHSGDMMIDTSIENQLSRMKKILLERKILGEEFYEN